MFMNYISVEKENNDFLDRLTPIREDGRFYLYRKVCVAANEVTCIWIYSIRPADLSGIAHALTS